MAMFKEDITIIKHIVFFFALAVALGFLYG